MEFNDVPCTMKGMNKPETEFCNNKLLYIPPAKRGPLNYIRPYKKPVIKIDYGTTYTKSYVELDSTPKVRINYGKHMELKANNTGKFDFDTTYKLSYQPTKRITSRLFVPQPNLSMNGSHDMQTTHGLSYLNPGYSRATICIPHRGKLCCPMSMENKTVMKESYQDFGGPVNVKRPPKPTVWRTSFKTDYHTTNQMSYQYVKPMSKIRIAQCRPFICTPIEKDTIYKTSFGVPGHFVNKETVSCV